jgi:hypothetical protein
MNDADWKAIPGRLQAAGFTVYYDRISYAPSNPLWRANAHREGRSWSTLGKDLESALVALEGHTAESAGDWREALLHAHADPVAAESPQVHSHSEKS